MTQTKALGPPFRDDAAESSSDVATAWRRIVVLANRAPYRHERAAHGGIAVMRSASGLVTALEPLVDAYAGTWVAHGAGTADHAVVDDRGGLNVPPANPRYRLRYVSLAPHEHRGYYLGFANEGLWPLCHAVNVQPVFRPSDFRMYQLANARFATAVCEEVESSRSLILVQDYHFALAPRLLRYHRRSSTIVAFWHIPWPDDGVFSACPWGRDLLNGLLGSDIVGFQTPQDCANFLDSVNATLDADIDRAEGVVTMSGHSTRIRAYPVGIEWNNQFVRATAAPEVCRAEVCRELQLPSEVRLGLGVDRLDYTKGINEKFLAVERLLERHPEFRGRFVFVQIAEPSRDSLPAYRYTRALMAATSERVNRRFGTDSYRPIVMIERHHEPADVYRLYRAADLCYVGSLHDGMNLVAKEFVAARDDERGVLLLSRFAGATRQLREAVAVNPYSVDESARALVTALGMTNVEQSHRMRHMRQIVEQFDARWWAERMLRDASTVRSAQRHRRLYGHRIPARISA